MVNFVLSDAFPFCLKLSEKFSQPGEHVSAQPFALKFVVRQGGTHLKFVMRERRTYASHRVIIVRARRTTTLLLASLATAIHPQLLKRSLFWFQKPKLATFFKVFCTLFPVILPAEPSIASTSTTLPHPLIWTSPPWRISLPHFCTFLPHPARAPICIRSPRWEDLLHSCHRHWSSLSFGRKLRETSWNIHDFLWR